MTEIEHKYLVKDDSYKKIAVQIVRIRQGYLNRNPDRTVRIRLTDTSSLNDDVVTSCQCSQVISKGFITIKGRNHGDTRKEFEYEIPCADAEELIKFALSPIIEKTRYVVPYESHIWEIDEFISPIKGLIVAEIELNDSNHDYILPDFIGEEVTGKPEYYNSNIQSYF